MAESAESLPVSEARRYTPIDVTIDAALTCVETIDTDMANLEAGPTIVKTNKVGPDDVDFSPPKPSFSRTWLLLIASLAVAAVVIVVVIVAVFNSSYSTGALQETTTNQENSRPNFIFVLADDLGWNSIGNNNYDRNFSTPFMDQLAQNGIIFTQYYSQEICTPARSALLTGRYPILLGMQTGVITQTENVGLPLDETLLPQILKEYGNYTNYMLGKWHLGVFKPNYLPTARGFDYFLGFMGGATYMWSKRSPVYTDYYDISYADRQCYNVYDGADVEDYSTFFYRDKAVNIIQQHDYAASPMFLYLAQPATHAPFSDIDSYADGIPQSYLAADVYAQFVESIAGEKVQQYAMSLYLLDQSLQAMYEALESVGQLNNTYIIFTSDNGGFTSAGGRNGPLRGEKGSLYEGGTKVDAFIYSPLLSSPGTLYSGITHITDWLPTLLSLASINYTAPEGYPLSGYDQSEAMSKGESYNKRTHLLYNMYFNVANKYYNIYTNGSAAIRDKQYKLLHAYDAGYTEQNEVNANDDALAQYGTCENSAGSGDFGYYLFDLLADPYESVNLYDNDSYADIKASLYTQLTLLQGMSKTQPRASSSSSATTYWGNNGQFSQPWQVATDTGKPYPSRCSKSGLIVSPVY